MTFTNNQIQLILDVTESLKNECVIIILKHEIQFYRNEKLETSFNPFSTIFRLECHLKWKFVCATYFFRFDFLFEWMRLDEKWGQCSCWFFLSFFLLLSQNVKWWTKFLEIASSSVHTKNERKEIKRKSKRIVINAQSFPMQCQYLKQNERFPPSGI